MPNELLDKLEALPPSPFPLHSWPMSPDLVDDSLVLRQVARITRSVSSGFQYVGQERLAKQLAMEPEWLVLHLSPFHHNFNGYVWRRNDWRRDANAPVVSFLDWVPERAAMLRDWVGDQKMIFILDHEKWPMPDNAVVDALLNAVVAAIRYVFPDSLFAWYDWGRERYGAVSTDVVSDFACESLYFQPGSPWNEERLNVMADRANRHGLKTMPWVSLGACYDERPYTPIEEPWTPKQKKHSPGLSAPTQLGQTWALGRRLAEAKVDAVCLYPELWEPTIPDMPQHFIKFVQGIHENRFEHGEG